MKAEVRIPLVDRVHLGGTLTVPVGASGIVLFAHGSGSSRYSPRNQYVARCLNEAGLGTLLFDLLTADEEELDLRTGQLRFDIPLLARRLGHVTEWLGTREDVAGLDVGYFGSSTGGGAALVPAAAHAEKVGAVVSRGGRPDLAGAALEQVRAPTLLIVGGADHAVIELNRKAMARMPRSVEVRLELVPGATHLFEEPGALEAVARLAAGWFGRLGSRVGISANS
jgi:putative phosphoribosyl transferase